MNIRTLKAQHRILLNLASELAGLAARIQTADHAIEAERMLERIDIMLVHHLTIEDNWLYPSLMAADDANTRDFAADSFEEMGGILGAWVAYRTQWVAAAIKVQPDRFAAATRGIVGALAMRVEREEDHLYPAMDRLVAIADRPVSGGLQSVAARPMQRGL